MLAFLFALAIQDIDSRIDDVAKTLKDPAVADCLKTRPGKVALKEQLEATAAEARDAAKKTVVADFIKELVDDAGKLRNAALAKKLIEDFESARTDLKELRVMADETIAKIAAEGLSGKVADALKQDERLRAVYLLQIRLLAGRDVAKVEEAIMKKLGGIFVTGADGSLTLREDLAENLGEHLEKLEKQCERADELAKALAKFAGTIKDEGTSGKIKKMLTTPCAAALFLGKNQDLDTDAILDHLEEWFSDGVLIAGKEEDAAKQLASFDEGSRRLEAFKAALDRIGGKITDANSGARLRKLFTHDVVRISVVKEYAPPGFGARGLKEAWQAWIALIFDETDGVLRVKESMQAQITEGIKKMNTTIRDIRKGCDAVAAEGRRIDDAEPVKAAFTDPIGQAQIADMLKARAEAITISDAKALELWVAKHFENGVARDGAKAALDALVEKAAKIQKLLEKNDLDK